MLIEKNQKMKLTRSRVEAFHVVGTALVVWDNQLPGFGVRVSAHDVKTYFLFYRVGKGGRQRGKTIARHPLISTDRAREIAREWLLQAWSGKDPNAPTVRDDSNPTVADFSVRYIKEHCEVRKKPGPTKTDQLYVGRFIVPKIGRLRVRAVTRFDIGRIHSSMAKTPVQANAVRALLSHMFAKCEEWGLRPDGTNPVRHIKKFPTKPRERYLTEDELKRLTCELGRIQISNTVVANFARLVLLTGCRLSKTLSHGFQQSPTIDANDLDHGWPAIQS